MTNKEFIIDKLDRLVGKCPATKYICEHDLIDNTFYISLLSNNKKETFYDFKWALIEECIELYPYTGILFVSEDDIITTENPIYKKVGKKFKESIKMLNNKNMEYVPKQKKSFLGILAELTLVPALLSLIFGPLMAITVHLNLILTLILIVLFWIPPVTLNVIISRYKPNRPMISNLFDIVAYIGLIIEMASTLYYLIENHHAIFGFTFIFLQLFISIFILIMNLYDSKKIRGNIE